MNPIHAWPTHRWHRGATLIEQIMVVVIASILTCVALPSLRRLLARHEVRTAQTSLIASLQQARALAAQTGRRSVACPTRDGTHCSNEASWDGGWLVGFRGDQASQLDGPPQYSRVDIAKQLTIQSNAGRHYVQFQSSGFSDGSNLTVLICRRSDPSHVVSVKVSQAGRVRGADATADEAAQCAGTG